MVGGISPGNGRARLGGGEVVLSVTGRAPRRWCDVVLTYGGDLGFAGLMGAGGTGGTCAGRRGPKDAGTVVVRGREVSSSIRPGKAGRHRLPIRGPKALRSSARSQPRDNLVLASDAGFRQRLWLRARPKDQPDRRGLRHPVEHQDAVHRSAMHNLSGGNQQKAVVAKWLIRDCEVLI
jgi:ABC-type sugar transport system ATPase subunit